MHNIKKMGVILLVSILAFVIAGCGPKKENNNAPASNNPIKLTFAFDQSPSDTWTQAARKFAELVEQKTDGAISITVHDSGTLGSQRQALEAILAGTVHGTATLEPISYWVEDVGIYGIPYLFRDQAHLDQFLNGDLGAELHQKMIDKGFRPIMIFKRPPRLISSGKPIENLQDLNGMKIRVPESPTAPPAFKAMGAAPVTMAFSEVYSALETSVIDGQENPITTFHSNRFYEVQKYIAHTNHQFQVGYVIFSESAFASLSDEHKKALTEAAKEAEQFEADLIANDMNTIENDLTEAGVTFTHPDLASFSEAAKSAYSGYNSLMQDWVQKIQNLQ